jgi:putative aldouronate transport system permease protein
MIYIFFSPESGIVNRIISVLGGDKIHFMLEERWFRPLYIGSGLWQHAGWDSILYIATLTSLDPGLYEAATIDGASRLQKMRYIEIPALVPIFVMMLILSCGRLLNSDTEKVLLLQTAGNSTVADVFGTYVHNVGIGKAQFSYTTAIGLMINIINFMLVVTVNKFSNKLTGSGLF